VIFTLRRALELFCGFDIKKRNVKATAKHSKTVLETDKMWKRYLVNSFAFINFVLMVALFVQYR